MTQAKSGFKFFLGEFDGSSFGNAFTANVLGHTQLTQDTQQGDDEEEQQKDKEAKLRKEIEDSLSDETNNDDSIIVDKDDKDPKDTQNQRILKHLKNLLFNMPGAENVDLDAEPEEHNPSTADNIVFNNGKELMSNGQPVQQSPYQKFDDPNNPREMPDNNWNKEGEGSESEDKHEQLIAMIKDLRDELRQSRNGGEAIEQEEDVAETEEDEGGDETQFANAGKLFQTLINQKLSRQKIISQFEKNLGVTNSTAVSYYQRLAKDAGLTNAGSDQTVAQAPAPGMGMGGFQDPAAVAGGGQPSAEALPQETNITGTEVPNDPNRQGLIRTVKGAHLVYKRKNEEGTFDELWVFGVGGGMEDSLKVRRNILSGTDIPPRATKSQNGSQSYTLKTLGNGQILHIKGLPN